MKGVLRSAVLRLLSPLERRILEGHELREKTSPAAKAAQRLLFHHYRERAAARALPPLRECGLRVFSQFEEDGKLLCVFAALGIPRGSFVDIGAGDGIMNNCANLALNFGWTGVFVDGDPERIRRGESFYREHPDACTDPPRFVCARVLRENVNELLRAAGAPRETDLLSIDIDGNDYWVWEALEAVEPKVVIIETHVEFGLRSIVVPYDPQYVYPGRHPDYHGASPAAMEKLARRRGYRLVGANEYGFNTIWVRRGLAEELLPEVSVESVLQHPRNRERAARFGPIKDWEYVEV